MVTMLLLVIIFNEKYFICFKILRFGCKHRSIQLTKLLKRGICVTQSYIFQSYL